MLQGYVEVRISGEVARRTKRMRKGKPQTTMMSDDEWPRRREEGGREGGASFASHRSVHDPDEDSSGSSC